MRLQVGIIFFKKHDDILLYKLFDFAPKYGRTKYFCNFPTVRTLGIRGLKILSSTDLITDSINCLG